MKYTLGFALLVTVVHLGAMDNNKYSNKEQLFSPTLYHTIFKNDFLHGDNHEKDDHHNKWNDERAYHTLDTFFKKHDIKDYADAGNFKTSSDTFVNADELSERLNERFKTTPMIFFLKKENTTKQSFSPPVALMYSCYASLFSHA